jgi:predicted small integral membrane protein
MREEHMMTNPDIATEARRIASERKLWRCHSLGIVVLALALAVFCWGSAALAWEALWR